MFLRQAAASLLKRIRPSLSNSVYASRKKVASATALTSSFFSKRAFSYQNGSRGYNWRANYRDRPLWIILSGQAAIGLGLNADPVLAEDVSIQSSSKNDVEESDIVGFRKVEDGSVISNEHTSKWRVFTDAGRDYFLQGNLEQAEQLFLSALQEAKEGFGERDPHVASACNNLAEFYRIKKEFNKAEPLYLEAINILEEAFGPEDIRVGVALDNVGIFYYVQRKLGDARKCYERALKIKGRVLGHSNIDYADTMFRLGMVLSLQGKEKDSEVLIQESIRILEEDGHGESKMCIRRLQYLAQIYLNSNRLAEAENVQRKILHIMELSKGWNSLETIISAERLALLLKSAGNLSEAHDLLERCLDARTTLLPKDHIQIGANMLHIARVAMLNASHLRKRPISEAIAELDKAKDLLDNSVRIAQQVLNELKNQKGNRQKNESSGESTTEGRAALLILLQSLESLAQLEVTKQELLESREELLPTHEAENALLQCISAYKEFGTESLIGDSPQVEPEYLSCLKHLSRLIDTEGRRHLKRPTLPELRDEIKRIELEISAYRKRKNQASR